MNKTDLTKKFLEIFGESGEVHYFHAPGRVNIIGEHTDYNGGYVLPCAINMGTTALLRRRDDDLMRFASCNFDLAVDTRDTAYDKAHDWANYPKGMVHLMHQKGYDIGGFEVLFYGDLPNGAGLSSSASIEIVTGMALNELFDCRIKPVDMALLAQRCENEYIGVNCGIMDQFVIAVGKKNEAVFLNCGTLDYRAVPLNLGEYRIVIMNTNKRRALADSKYNERRGECEAAVAALRGGIDIRNLTDVSFVDFEAHAHLIKDEATRRRARHVITENRRVVDAADAIATGDLHELGRLMTASHESLKDDYEVTGVELDTIVEEALKIPDTLGARMTGAGFGGCAIALVRADGADDFVAEVKRGYMSKIGYAPAFYVAL